MQRAERDRDEDEEWEDVVERLLPGGFREAPHHVALDRVRPQGPSPKAKPAEYIAAPVLDLWDPRSPAASNRRRMPSAVEDGLRQLSVVSATLAADEGSCRPTRRS